MSRLNPSNNMDRCCVFFQAPMIGLAVVWLICCPTLPVSDAAIPVSQVGSNLRWTPGNWARCGRRWWSRIGGRKLKTSQRKKILIIIMLIIFITFRGRCDSHFPLWRQLQNLQGSKTQDSLGWSPVYELGSFSRTFRLWFQSWDWAFHK